MEDEEPFTLEAAWADLQHGVAVMLAAFGCALAIAERLILPRKARIDILQWLAPLEATGRRLVLLEALKLPAPNQPAPFIPKGKLASAYADRPEEELPDDETRWNVRFHVWTADASPANRKKAGGAAAVRSHPIRYNAIPLARRVEALRRLYDQREMYAKRLAQRLHHAPKQARKAFAPYRHRATVVLTLMRRVQREVDLALNALNTS